MVAYEIFVRSFRDSNGDGIGDIKGVVYALDYLQDIHVDILWLTPIFPSPSFHGYDVVDYYSVNPLYGNVEDLKDLLGKAHSLGMKVMLDLPLSHTSVQHPWFSEKPDYYIWADDGTDINERRPWDDAFIWHPLRKRYYRGLFGPCTPDLNYENEAVVNEAVEVVKFWRGVGVDGFRFDAAKHIYENHEKNLEFWRKISQFAGKFNVAEVWDPPSVTKLYSDVVGYALNFHLFGSLIKSVKERKPDHLYLAIKETGSAMKSSFNFLSSHDTSRLVSQFPGEKERLFAISILMTLPGVPVIYYGDELGVPGIYDPYFPEHVAEPFPWWESGCGEGQTRWKSFRFSRPHQGLSYEHQKSGESFLKKVSEWISFRSQNSWIDEAGIKDLSVDQSSISYTLSGRKSMMVKHNFEEFQTEVKWKAEP